MELSGWTWRRIARSLSSGIWRGPRGEDVGATARPDSRHSSRDSDEVVVTALRARFGAPVGMMAFPMIRCMREGEERGGYDGNRTSTTNGNASFPVADDGEEGEEDEMELSALVPCCGVKTDGRRRCWERSRRARRRHFNAHYGEVVVLQFVHDTNPSLER
uniref:Uncharacterized protein n=1 Tax=Oryza rufipogon TaxID=4529 RepID=A0A0E0PK41_ORYRU